MLRTILLQKAATVINMFVMLWVVIYGYMNGHMFTTIINIVMLWVVIYGYMNGHMFTTIIGVLGFGFCLAGYILWLSSSRLKTS